MEQRVAVQTGKALHLNVGDHVLFGPDDGTIRTKQLVSKTIDDLIPYGEQNHGWRGHIPHTFFAPNLILEFHDGTLCEVRASDEVVRLLPHHKPIFVS